MKIVDTGYIYTFTFSSSGDFDGVPCEVINDWYFKWTAKDGTIQEVPCEDLGDSLFSNEKISHDEAFRRWCNHVN